MKKFLFLFAPLLLLISSCGPEKVQEGEIEYAITYPNSEISGIMQAVLPETMTITFKGTKMKSTIARGNLFATEIISDESDRSIEMRLEFGTSWKYTVLNKDEVSKFIASQPVYELESLDKTDSIAGMFATSYKVKCEGDTMIREHSWFTPDLAMQDAYWFTPYAGTNGTPLIFDVERYGVMMHVEAVKITKREVLDSEFDRSKELAEVSFDAYEKEVQELFDALME